MTKISPKNIIRSGLCIGCGSCAAQASSESGKEKVQMKFDRYGQLKPYGPRRWMVQPTTSFIRTCPFSPLARNEDQLSDWHFGTEISRHKAIGRYIANYAGAVSEDDFRAQGSSGGMVSWVATELMRKGLIDGLAHVAATEDPKADGRYFRYRISRTEQQIREGAKSRYYPVDLAEVLQTIREVPGHYAVVAIPCMIKAIQLLRKEDSLYRDRIRFTLGLFCGHMKSARFVESFAWQMNVPVSKVKGIDYRFKNPDRPANWYNVCLSLEDGRTKNRDWWHLADGDWGAGFFMNPACNFCDDVAGETADVSFGDAWVEPFTAEGRGTNVVVVRSPVIHQIIRAGMQEGRLDMKAVNAGFTAQSQAAGLRQRREGLAFRLSRMAPSPVRPLKRITAYSLRPSARRRSIYRMRYRIAAWSHRLFWLARKLHWPAVYLLWAKTVLTVYHGIVYHQGSLTEMKKRFQAIRFRK